MLKNLLRVLVGFFPFVVFAGTGFEPGGQRIPDGVFERFEFPKDLSKTNLSVVSANPANPFEWAGRIQTLSNNGTKSPCSAGVVVLPGYRLKDRALVLTAGHCVARDGETLKPREVLLDFPLREGRMFFEFPRPRKFRDGSGKVLEQSEFSFTKVIFASLDSVDIALLEMNLTYAQLEYGAQSPPLLARTNFQLHQKIRTFGIPYDSEYSSELFHESRCKVKGVVTGTSTLSNLSVGTYNITERVAMDCTVFEGMSGGYIRNERGQVIGVASGVLRDSYALYADASPLMKCAQKAGVLDRQCLLRLKEHVQNLKPVPDSFRSSKP